MGETPTAEAALRIDRLGNSVTMVSSLILACSRFWLGALFFGGIGETEPVFSNTDTMFFITLWFGGDLVLNLAQKAR